MAASLNLVLVVSSLGCGGAERVVQLLSGGFVKRGHRVTVITTTERDDFFPLADKVERVRLNVFGRERQGPERRPAAISALWHAAKGLPALREIIRHASPDFIITFGDEINVLVLAVLFSMRRKVVATEHVDPRWHRQGPVLQFLRRRLYPSAHCLVSVSHGVDAGFHWLPRSRRTVIHNPVVLQRESESQGGGSRSFGRQYIVAMGRFVRQKGFDLLLDAFSNVSRAYPQWALVLLGDGPEREELVRKAQSLEIGDSVHFAGAVSDPATYLSHAAFFVMSSRFEGFGNVLVEAMACGLPVVSFDCPSGPADIIDDGRNGLLVAPEDTAALAQAMVRMIADETMRGNMARQAQHDALRFDLDSTLDAWQKQVFDRDRV
ncbi:glycosyltransferase family 4 protein [Aromatoleum toluclasticum]|uniref:glycosyltransferase family 4 protein n=1 Tax=Aromatoleum toluclasticum TaxID=92003 RepID=UPI001D18A1AB|nr:glycosyltransferase family 4 protein [Aromatoleum toluclasticum]MCC4114263.1 glycosyltransferase family 4 protein [Aromatoleum toluclasticum]